MEINYQKFKICSETTQKEIIGFSRMLLNSMELYDPRNQGKLCLYDFEKGNFDLQKIAGLWKILNEIIDNRIIEISHPIFGGWGPVENRRLTVDLKIKYKSDTKKFIKKFLDKVDFGDDKNFSKIVLEINKKQKEVRNKLNNKIFSFRKATGENKRFNYLLTLIKNPKKVSGMNLNSIVTPSSLSGEIEEINTNLKNSLDLAEKVIINNNNSGYEINSEIYTFKII